MPMASTRSSTDRRDALRFLDDDGQSLLGHVARLEEPWEVASLSELRDAQLDRAGPRLPVRSPQPLRWRAAG